MKVETILAGVIGSRKSASFVSVSTPAVRHLSTRYLEGLDLSHRQRPSSGCSVFGFRANQQATKRPPSEKSIEPAGSGKLFLTRVACFNNQTTKRGRKCALRNVP